MNRGELAQALTLGAVGVLGELRRELPDESPYALAILLGQCGGYLGYAIATEEGLRRVASLYDNQGYRCQGWEGEEFDNLERLAIWLRWANPDDGWRYGDFPEQLEIAPLLADLVEAGEFGEEAEDLEEFCTDVLALLPSNSEWLTVGGERVVVGVTYGSDPRDFLRTATRANRYDAVCRLWAEYWQGEELSHKIAADK